jgi:hypothetical protein
MPDAEDVADAAGAVESTAVAAGAAGIVVSAVTAAVVSAVFAESVVQAAAAMIAVSAAMDLVRIVFSLERFRDVRVGPLYCMKKTSDSSGPARLCTKPAEIPAFGACSLSSASSAPSSRCRSACRQS